MKPFLIKIGITFFIICSLFGIERFYHFLTDDFSYSNIVSNFEYDPEWNIPIDQNDWIESQKALNQTYTYLNSGSQSYAFISKDQQYILKFFKHKRWILNPLFESLPVPQFLDAKKREWKQKKQEKLRSTFKSCLISYREFKNETGTLFVHLNKIPIDHVVTLKDRIGFKHRIKLNDVEFALQRRAIPTDQYLLSLKKEGQIKEAQKALSALLAFTLKRALKGYSDKDPHLIRNFGFIDGKAIEIDIGGFHHDPKKDLKYFHTYEIKKIQRRFLPWIEKNYPELLPHAKKELAKLTL